jgi:hypothetical protein
MFREVDNLNTRMNDYTFIASGIAGIFSEAWFQDAEAPAPAAAQVWQ